MKYTEKFFELRGRITSKPSVINVDDRILLYQFPFTSENFWNRIFETAPKRKAEQPDLGMNDGAYLNNNHFTYPVFVPHTQKKFSRAIILLHGLNERFWDKYLPWAYYLALHTNRPVILFPLSFHMNRAPSEWADPRLMAPLVDKRKTNFKTSELTFVNLALSSRLTEDPLRFMRSGHQSAEDLIKLTSHIEQGLFPFIARNTVPDFFAYSIGAFVAQILFLANPSAIFSDSKFFLFCGGSVFKEMHGVSKLIMDELAYDTIYNYYTNEMNKAFAEKKKLGTFLRDTPLGNAFYAMLKNENNQNFREQQILASFKNMYSIALKKDKVISALGINSFFEFARPKHDLVETLDYPFEYCHENPFPVSGKLDRHIVDYWFEETMTKAANFLN